MNKFHSLLVAALSLTAFNVQSAQTAQARLYCISPRFSHASDIVNDYELDLTSTGNLDSGTGELVPNQAIGTETDLPGTQSYLSLFVLYDDILDDTFYGTIYLSIPSFTDVNQNRFPDFFEVSRGLSTTTTYGSYSMAPNGSGSVTATWNRSAGSKSGTCTLVLQNIGNFHHTFDILEYTGTLSYTPGSNNVSGTIALSQTGNPSSTRSGSMQFVKSTTDHFNELTNQPGSWLDASLQSLPFTNHYFFRDPLYPTNYAGYIEFNGDPSGYTTYANWVLSINDTNDSNANGVPNFSDDPAAVAPPRRPLLTLSRGSGNLLLKISGDTGHLHQVQEVTSITSTNWQTIQSVTLTNDPQTVTLTLPSGPRFWRVLAQ